MGLLQESSDHQRGIDQKLEKFNRSLQKRASDAGVPVGPIEIKGAGGDPQAKLDAIRQQYDGLVERLSIPPLELPDSSD
jgi:hypothetical protein